MRMSGAEKVGLTGAVLLAGALVAATIIMVLSGRGPVPNPDPAGAGGTGVVATGTGAPPEPTHPGDPASDEPQYEPEPPKGEAGLQRELARLKSIIDRRDIEVLRLKTLLDEAGIPYQEESKPPALVAREAIEELRQCGPETGVDDIQELLDRIVAAGSPAVGEIERVLGLGMDVKFMDSWTVLSGRLLGYPGLRLALIDSLSRIGGISGESALITALRTNEDPLEICMLISHLERVGSVASVQEVRADAALRYLDLEPYRKERMLIVPLLGVLASLTPPEEAANALLRYARSPGRNSAMAEIAVGYLNQLPAETAISALIGLAIDRRVGKKAESAAKTLVLRDGLALDSISDVLSKCAPGVRGVIYRFLARPAQEKLKDARIRGSRSGLEALALLDALDESIVARQAIADEWREKEREAALAGRLQFARSSLSKLASESAELRERLTVE